MAALEIKNVNSPDEIRSLAGMGEGGMVTVGGHPVMHGTFEPGWKWSEHMKPVVGTESCEAPHLLYCFSGRMKVVCDDGTEGEIGPGDVASIAPGHDAWIIGDEPFHGLDFGGYSQYALPHS